MGKTSLRRDDDSSARWWHGRRGDAAVLAFITLFFTLMFAEQIFRGKFLLAGDPLYYSYPLRTVGWEMLRQGQLPLWTPLVLSGYPLLSMSQLAFAYPLTWGHLFLPGHWAEQVYVLAPFLLSPAFTYAYAREVGRSRTAALLAGLAFGYGGMMCSGIAFAGVLSNSMLWLPLVLIPIDRAWRRRGRFVSLLVGASAAYTLSVLNGHGQSFLYTGIVAAAYGFYLSLVPPPAREEKEDANDGETGDKDPTNYGRASKGGDGASILSGWREWGRWRPLFVALGALLCAAGLAAFQILETMRAARRSIRNTLSYEAISTGAFTFKEAVASLLIPLNYSTDVSAYVPSLALIFAALALVALVLCRDERRDARIYFWLAVAVVGWVLMLGPNTPAQQLVYRLPLLNKFRVPSRHTFEWTFAVAIIAAYGWDIAVRRGWLAVKPSGAARMRHRRGFEKIVIAVLLSLAVAIGVYWWRAVQVPGLPGTSDYTGLPESTFLLWKTAFTLVLLVLIWRSARVASQRARAGLWMTAIAVACFVEPSAAISRWYEGMLFTEERFRVVSPTTRFLQNYPASEMRVYTRVQLYSEEFTTRPRLEAPNLTALYGIQNLAGYEPLIFERYSRALGGVGMDTVSEREGYAGKNARLFRPRSHVLDLLNTHFVVSYSNLALAVQNLMHREGVAYFMADMQTSVDPGTTETLGGGAGEADTLALVTSLAGAGEMEQDTEVARVRVQFSGAPAVERILRAGIDTAEWAHERPDVRHAVRHALAPVFDARPGDEQNSFPAYRYIASLPLGARGRVEKIEITNLTSRSSLALWKATLHDSASKTSTPISAVPYESWETVYQQDHALIMRNRRALPRAWLVGAAESVDGEEAFRRISGEGAHSFDPRRTALLEVAPAEMPALTGGELAAGSTARIVEYEPNRLSIETNANEPSILVVSEMFYPGWEATVDGSYARIHLTNYLLRGVHVPAGAHRVEMRYTAPAARNGAFIAACTFVGLCLLSLFDRRAKRRRRNAVIV
ncbi:MAG TPA: YfhO family protein [Pyrinomonadaceae bacterium]|nr:YfhO family protein [Pyrinomonadaceae bacterium]